MINISSNKCVGCGICESKCPTGAISVDCGEGIAVIDRDRCTGCGICLQNCPQRAISDIEGELRIAIGTDNGKVIKEDDHVGMSKYFQIWDYSEGKIEFAGTRENSKYVEEGGRVHGDHKKAEATASVLAGVDVLVGKMMGPNVERLKRRFVLVIVREPKIDDALRIIERSINEIFEEKGKTERHAIILNGGKRDGRG